APVVTIDKSCPNGAAASTDRFQPKAGAANAGSALACNTGSTTYNPTPGSAYTITEAAAATTPATDLGNYDTTYSSGCSGTLARGGTATCTITNTLKSTPTVTIDKSCPNGAYAASDRFQAKDGPTDAGSPLACNTGSASYHPTPGSAYTITEAAATTTPATDLGNYATSYSAGCSEIGRAACRESWTITNSLKAAPVVTIDKSCPNGADASTDRFQAKAGPAN